MKKILLGFILFISLKSIGQAPNLVGGSHGKLVVFCGYDVNVVNHYFTQYLYEDLDYTSADDNTPPKPCTSVEAFVKKITSNNKKLWVTYSMKPVNDTLLVTACHIKGNWHEVAYIFVDYWETKMNLDELKGKSGIVKYTITDKITFNCNLNTGTATIDIVKNQ